MSSYLYVKAVDQAGNEIIATMLPAKVILKPNILDRVLTNKQIIVILIIVVVAILSAIIWLVFRPTRYDRHQGGKIKK